MLTSVVLLVGIGDMLSAPCVVWVCSNNHSFFPFFFFLFFFFSLVLVQGVLPVLQV